MARILVSDKNLKVKLNVAEKLLALRRDAVIPLADVRSARVVDQPWDQFIPTHVSIGFAGAGAPGRTIATVGPRARSGAGKALVVVYRNQPSVVIDIDPTRTGWSLVIASVKDPERIRDALAKR